MSNIKDYYAVLGLDIEASAESIKAAYRRLARENHPDRAGHLGPEAMAQAQKRMADLNEAYAVLSDSKLRREYDSKWRAAYAPRSEDLQTAVDTIKEEQQKQADVATIRARAKQRAESAANLAKSFAQQVRTELQNNQATFKWKAATFEGFEWGLEASFIAAKYMAAMRSFGVADRAAAQKLTNYASFAYSMHQSRLRANYFLFVMAFQRAAELEAVRAECMRFVQTPAPATVLGTTPLILLLDAGAGRSLLCGAEPTDKRFRDLLNSVRVRKA